MKKGLLFLFIILSTLLFSFSFAEISSDDIDMNEWNMDAIDLRQNTDLYSDIAYELGMTDVGAQLALQELQAAENGTQTYMSSNAVVEDWPEIAAQDNSDGTITLGIAENIHLSESEPTYSVGLYIDDVLLQDTNGNYDTMAGEMIRSDLQSWIRQQEIETGQTPTTDQCNTYLQDRYGEDGNVRLVISEVYVQDNLLVTTREGDPYTGQLYYRLGCTNDNTRVDSNFGAGETNEFFSVLADICAARSRGETTYELNGKTIDISSMNDWDIYIIGHLVDSRLWGGLDGMVYLTADGHVVIIPDDSGPDDDDDDDDPDDPPKPPQNSSGPWHTLTQNGNTYNQKEANASYKISKADNREYNVDIAIPTSEFLNFHATANSQKYAITVRTWHYDCGINNVRLYQTCSFDYNLWENHPYWVENLVEVEDEETGEKKWEDHGHMQDNWGWWPHSGAVRSSQPMINKNYVRTAQKDYWDVPDPAYNNVTGVTISNVPVDGGSVTVPLSGAGTPNGYKIKVHDVDPQTDTSEIIAGRSFENLGSASEAYSLGSAVANSVTGEVQDRDNQLQAYCNWTPYYLQSGNPPYRYDNNQYPDMTVTIEGGQRGKPGVKQSSNDVKNRLIPSTKRNGLWATSGLAKYSNGLHGQTNPASGNNVTVHTPVITKNAKVIADKFINQVKNKDSSITYLQLDEGFKILIPDSGVHNDFPGYKSRKYNSNQAIPQEVTNWGAIKDVKMPFDVYVYSDDGKDLYFLPKDEWLSDFVDKKGIKSRINYEMSRESTPYKFLVPVWAPEGVYKDENAIQIRVVAENAKANDAVSRVEPDLNSHNSSYVAIKYFPVEVIGKVYDLQINESTDVDWMGNVQSLGYTTGYVRANEFPFGRTKAANTTISGKTPINPSQNKNAAYQYAPKLGYTFVFNFKTKGRKSENVDILIADDFYFVAKAGGDAIKTALYYKGNDGNYKKITKDNAANLAKLGVTLNNKFMGVQPSEMTSSSSIYPKEQVPNTPYNYSLNVNIGSVAKLNLPHSLRLVYDNFREYATDNGGRGLYRKTRQGIINDITSNNSIAKNYPTFKLPDEQPADLVVGSVGHWYAGYALPSTTVAVNPSMVNGKPDSEVDRMIKANTPNLQYRTGYILVKFGITTRTKDKQDYLVYTGPEMLNNMGDIPNRDDKETQNPPIPGKQWTDPELDWESNGFVPIILPSGTPANIPQGAVAIYETDYSATIDNNSVLAH